MMNTPIGYKRSTRPPQANRSKPPNAHTASHVNLYRNLRDVQQVMYRRLLVAKISNKALADLARSFVQVVDLLRVLKGIPDPGRLVPSMTPKQAMAMLRNSRRQLSLAGPGAVLDVTEITPKAETPEPAKPSGKEGTEPEKSSGSLLGPKEGDHRGEGEGAKTDNGNE